MARERKRMDKERANRLFSIPNGDYEVWEKSEAITLDDILQAMERLGCSGAIAV